MLEVGAREGQGELLPAVAGEDVASPQVLAPRAGELLEEAVARLVAVSVVELLEAIEVDDRDAESGAAAIGASELAAELLVPGPSIEQAGEVVRARRDLEPPEQLTALDRDRRFEREQSHCTPRLRGHLLEALPPLHG